MFSGRVRVLMETNMLRGAVLLLVLLASVHQARGQPRRPSPRNYMSGGGNNIHSNRKPRDPLAGEVRVGCSVLFKDERKSELLVKCLVYLRERHGQDICLTP